MRVNRSNSVPRPCTCTTVRRASRVLARTFDGVLEAVGLNVTQLAVLRAIQRHAGEALVRVAEDLCMDRTSLYRAVGTMRRSGWVVVREGPNARARSASVTAKGRRVLEAADPHWADAQAEVVDRFGRREWAALARQLERLAACAAAVGAARNGGGDGEQGDV